MGQSIGNLASHAVVQRGIAQITEGRRIFLKLTVEENLEMGGYTRPKGSISEGLERVFSLFPRLKERRRQIAGTLSGGEQQMLAMGRGLMSDPKLMMLDEPSMGLAPLLGDQVFSRYPGTSTNTGTHICWWSRNARIGAVHAEQGLCVETGAELS